MFDKYSFKKKFIFSILVLILLLMAVYKKTFSNVLSLFAELSNIEENLNNVEDSEFQLISLRTENSGLDAVIGGQSNEPEKVQQQILDFVSKIAENVSLVSIEDVHVFEGEKFKIYSNQLTFEGDYDELLQLLYKIEKDFLFSKVISSKIYTVTDYRTNKKSLRLHTILQNYEKVN